MYDFPEGSFHLSASVYVADRYYLWTSQMFPALEPYTETHRAFYEQLLGPLLREARAPRPANNLYVLTRDFAFVWRNEVGGVWYRLTVPAGFVTDIASVPLLVQMMFKIRSDGAIRPAALGHDIPYQLRGMFHQVPVVERFDLMLNDWVHDPRQWSKEAADKFFAKVMKAYQAPLSTLTYLGVRWGGHLAWHRTDKARLYTAALFNVPWDTRNGWKG